MHSASLAPQMETSLESKFSAAFEQQNASSGLTKNQLCNGILRKSAASSIVPSTTTATASTESSGEKTVSFRKGNDLESFESLSALFANGLFTDLVICCTGKMFKCHRVVMAAASLYIRDALSAFYNNSPDSNSSCNNCNTVMILPNEIKMSDMEAILRFIYDGHVEVKVDSIESFLRSARTLNIKGLANVNIVYNSNGTNEESFPDGIEVSAGLGKNNGYSKGHSILNGHTGMNSPPPSPPSLNSSLASLKALANAAPSATVNGNHLGSKLLNGTALNNSLINQFRNSSPLRNESSILGHNLTPAHQSSTPKSIFANGNLFNNNLRFDSTNNSQVASSGSRRKQKFPTSIPPMLTDMFPPATAALYNSLLGLNSEEDDEEDTEEEDKKAHLKEDNSSNDCSTTCDNLSSCSVDTGKQAALPFGVPLGIFNPQMPCMIEVEADPTTFPTYCQEMNDTNILPAQQKRRRPYKTSPYGPASLGNGKKLKLPYGAVPANSGLDVSIKPASPLMPSGAQVAATGLLSKKHGPAIPSEKPVFSPFPSAKTAAGANPYAAPSPSSSSSENWAASKWKCEICNKYYGNKQTLKEHMDYFHSNREEQIYICNICNKEYTWRKSLMKHYRDIHQMRNTPALAEINRQLAALATTKVPRPSVSSGPVPSSVSGDNAALQSMVSIANYNSQNSNLESSAKSSSSNNSDKSNRSESEMENENISDNVELRIKEEDDGNEEIEMPSSSPTPTDPESGDHNESGFHESKSSLSSPEKTNGSKTNGNAAEHSDNSSSALIDRSSPTSSLASS